MSSVSPFRASVKMHDQVDDAFRAQYERDGFAVLSHALSESEVDALNAEVVQICRSTPLPGVDLALESDDDVLRRFLCIHYPHKISLLAAAALHEEQVVEALTAVIGPNVKAMQSMLFVKSEGKPGQAWHQDEHFIPTRDRSLTAAWIALDDATLDNGCLWVIPGSHRRGVLYPDRDQDDPEYDCTEEAYGFPYTEGDAVPVEIPAGAALIFNGYLLHHSLKNSGTRGYRRALVNHYMSAESLLPWRSEAEGDHVGEADFRDIVLVAGEDPYSFKGLRDISTPHARGDKDGGCDR